MNINPQDINKNPQVAEAMKQEMMLRMIKSAKPILCKCGCSIYREGVQIVRSSKIDPNNPTGQDQLLHIPALYCIKCFDPVDALK